jgi:hypothetical protein
MGNFLATLPENWAKYLKGLADDHDVDISNVISGLCDWAFSSSDYRIQFEVWLDKTYPPKGQAEDKAKAESEEMSEREEEQQGKEEEEAHEDENYNEDRSEVEHE